jgi:hypothetical protein
VSAPDFNLEGSEIKIFPNPGFDHVKVEYSGQNVKGIYTIELLDIIGRTVYENSNTSESQGLISEHFRLDGLSNGVYFVRLSFGNDYIMKQFIKS